MNRRRFFALAAGTVTGTAVAPPAAASQPDILASPAGSWDFRPQGSHMVLYAPSGVPVQVWHDPGHRATREDADPVDGLSTTLNDGR